MFLARTYRESSRADRKVARLSMMHGEVQASKNLNEAALQWASYTFVAGSCFAAVLVGVAAYNAAEGSVRAVPLFIVAAVTLLTAMTVLSRFLAFRRLVGGN